APLPAGGPGVYVMKGDRHPEPRAAAPKAVMPASSSDALLPVVVFDPAPSTPPFPAAAHTPRPQVGAGVVVQRQVVVGAGATPPPTPAGAARTPPPGRTRRPAPSIPYVVKEGSHTQTRPSGPPARPMVPPPTAAPRTATASYHQGAAPQPQADVISDKSLDEVI